MSGRDEETGEWSKLQNEDIYAVYFSPDIRVIKIRMALLVRVARIGQS